MKLISVVLIIILSADSYAEDTKISSTEKIELDYFTNRHLSGGQSGCWYYFPAEKKQGGSVIALGESADNAIHMIINGEKVMIGNWKADYQKLYHNISYSSPDYQVQIHSKVLSESKFSSEYESTIKIKSKTGKTVIEVFGQCGS